MNKAEFYSLILGANLTADERWAIAEHDAERNKEMRAQREALARVEAERDAARSRQAHTQSTLRTVLAELQSSQAQLAEAVGLLRYSQEIARLFDDEHTAGVGRFLARHAQAGEGAAK